MIDDTLFEHHCNRQDSTCEGWNRQSLSERHERSERLFCNGGPTRKGKPVGRQEAYLQRFSVSTHDSLIRERDQLENLGKLRQDAHQEIQEQEEH